VIGVHVSFVSGFTTRSALGNYTSRLEIGVSVFFVISGFLLYRPFAKAHFEGSRPLPMRSFWARRLRRIIPAYWVAFLVITYVLHGDTIRHGWGSAPIYLGFAQIYFPNHAVKGISQAWSLCTEMSFYLALPLWAAGIAKKRRAAHAQLRAELAGLAILVAISFGYRTWVLQWHTQLASTMPSWLPGYADLFALGMLLAVVSAYLSSADRRPAWLWHPALPWASWALAGVAFVAVSNLGLPVKPVTASAVGLSLERQTLYGLFAFFMVLPAVFGPQDQGLGRRLLRARPVALIGVVSYGIYLWHEAAINLFLRWSKDPLFTIPWLDLFTAVTAMAIFAGTASYVLVERPILDGALPSRGRDGLRRLTPNGLRGLARAGVAGGGHNRAVASAAPTAPPAETLVGQR
jgi:peptidoglycan/LPS O-acetylase OafA/YrhL